MKIIVCHSKLCHNIYVMMILIIPYDKHHHIDQCITFAKIAKLEFWTNMFAFYMTRTTLIVVEIVFSKRFLCDTAMREKT